MSSRLEESKKFMSETELKELKNANDRLLFERSVRFDELAKFVRSEMKNMTSQEKELFLLKLQSDYWVD